MSKKAGASRRRDRKQKINPKFGKNPKHKDKPYVRGWRKTKATVK